MQKKHRTALAAALAAATAAPTLSADFVVRRWTSGSSYALEIDHMPDFDQRRNGLPADAAGVPGGMYCAPASGANLFAYIAAHGYPSVDPGVADFEHPAHHDHISGFIEQMGDAMLTHRVNGTFGPTAYAGFATYLATEAGRTFRVEMEIWSPWNTVSLKEMLRAGIDDRAVTMFAYGAYEELGVNACGEKVVWRDGGHFMTLVGGSRNGSTRRISFNDPDDSTNTSAQSDMDATDVVDRNCPWVDDLVVFPTVGGSCMGIKQSMNRIGGASGGYHKLIDFRLSVRPRSGHSWSSSSGFAGEVPAVESLVATTAPGGIEARVASAIVPVEGAGARPSLTVSPSGVPFLVVPGAGGGLFAEHRDDDGARLVPIDLAPLGIGAVDEAVFAGDRTLVVRTGRVLRAIGGLDDGPSFEEGAAPVIAWIREVPFVPAKLVASYRGQAPAPLPGANGFLPPDLGCPPCELEALPPGPHAVLAFAPDLRLAYEVSGDPAAEPRMRGIPAELPLGDGPADTLAADTTIVEDGHGTLWFARKGARELVALTAEDAIVVLPLEVSAITGLAIDDLDNLLVVDEGLVRSFSHGPEGIAETGFAGSVFAGRMVGAGFTVARSTSNLEARFHAHDGWYEGAAPTPCAGDLDGDGAVGGADLAALLGAWGSANAPDADLDGDGLVTGADLAIVLGAWGDCE